MPTLSGIEHISNRLVLNWLRFPHVSLSNVEASSVRDGHQCVYSGGDTNTPVKIQYLQVIHTEKRIIYSSMLKKYSEKDKITC